MTTALVLRTTDSRATDWWKATREALEQDRLKRVALIDELTETYGPGSRGGRRILYVFTDWMGTDTPTGMEAVGTEWIEFPAGWRFDPKKRHLVPALRTEEGKALARRLAEAAGHPWRQSSPTVGIPHDLRIERADKGGEHVYNAGISYDVENEILYQLWGSAKVYPALADALANSGIEWTEVPQSEWVAIDERLSQSDQG
jgi:hypothetical protein